MSGALANLRKQRHVSQLELSLRAGVSQRHLSCIETGRSRVGRDTLIALLNALDASLHDRNQALLAAGCAPAHATTPWWSRFSAFTRRANAPGSCHAKAVTGETCRQFSCRPTRPICPTSCPAAEPLCKWDAGTDCTGPALASNFSELRAGAGRALDRVRRGAWAQAPRRTQAPKVRHRRVVRGSDAWQSP